MYLISVEDKHIIQLMQWFESEQSLHTWSGTDFNYPFDLSSFKNDANIHSICSKVLVSAKGELLAFGQYYLRLGHCHLARLVVNPHKRGQGLVAELIAKLSMAGKSELGVPTCSLFVMADNKPAVKAYKKLGFKFTVYPKTMEIEDCLYMVNSSQAMRVVASSDPSLTIGNGTGKAD